jgi:colicin import membrane protein
MGKPYAYEKKAKRNSAIITLCFAAIVVVILFLFAFTPPYPPLEPEGILIDFGYNETGSGKIESSSQAKATPPATKDPVEQKVTTQDIQETIALPDKPKNNRPKETTKTETKVEEDPEPVIDESQTFDPNKFNFKNDSKSDGNTGDKGNQGNPDGNQNGFPGKGDGIGNDGSSGFGYDLSGRSMVSRPIISGTPPESGKVVLKITVNRNGIVTSASYERKGSTIVDSGVINEAIRSVKGKKLFNSDSDAPDTQYGTITINYRLK